MAATSKVSGKRIPYLKDLGVTAIYLNPIFQASSNHRYDTQDFMKIDPMLGTEEDFKNLIKDLHKNRIALILDGVFNHVGADSKYFLSAVTDKTGPYYSCSTSSTIRPSTSPGGG